MLEIRRKVVSEFWIVELKKIYKITSFKVVESAFFLLLSFLLPIIYARKNSWFTL
jgi:hypothetical protein